MALAKPPNIILRLRKIIFQKDLPFINVVLNTFNELGGYSAENFAQAEIIARQRISILLENSADFMIESNLAVQANYDWIENMIKRGYDVTLYFYARNL